MLNKEISFRTLLLYSKINTIVSHIDLTFLGIGRTSNRFGISHAIKDFDERGIKYHRFRACMTISFQDRQRGSSISREYSKDPLGTTGHKYKIKME